MVLPNSRATIDDSEAARALSATRTSLFPHLRALNKNYTTTIIFKTKIMKSKPSFTKSYLKIETG